MTSGESAAAGLVRRKTLSAHNAATMATVVDCGEFGRVTLDEPARQGGTGQGPSPLQAVLGALCGCEAVTVCRTATEMRLHYDSLNFEAAFTIDIRGGRASSRSGRFPDGAGARPRDHRRAHGITGRGNRGDRGALPGDESLAGRQGRPADRVVPRPRRRLRACSPVLTAPGQAAARAAAPAGIAARSAGSPTAVRPRPSE